MPSSAPRLCPCGATHEGPNPHTRKTWAPRPSAYWRGYNADYKAKREAVLKADPICTICNISPSTEVDHILPLSKGGGNDRSNLRGACKRCNAQRNARASKPRSRNVEAA